ncbi:hypothetical protein [Arthrobacter sp. CAL618]|uniref:hypothetical protein n=1 Tax=Arthrobacter sp. CAL618 TaxID=1055770 RepID=UPI00040FF6F3|nr:hypothetical protein [Arthrobacter sp. CAL618]
MQTVENPDGPLTKDVAAGMTEELTKDEESFCDKGAPDGCNVSHPDEWNNALISSVQ